MPRDQEAPGLTIGGAARALGVSENAVRQRIKRGSLAAAKVDGVWRVVLPVAGDHLADHEPDHHPGYQVDYQADQEATAVSPAATAQLAAIRDEWLRPLVDRIGALERALGRVEQERDTLRAELDRLRAEDGQKPNTERDATLPTGNTEPVPPSKPARRRRAWWWRLLRLP